MNFNVNYITDEVGNKMSVIVPYNEWIALQMNYRQLLSKLALRETIKEGIQEVKNARKKGIKLQSLSDFLNEC